MKKLYEVLFGATFAASTWQYITICSFFICSYCLQIFRACSADARTRGYNFPSLRIGSDTARVLFLMSVLFIYFFLISFYGVTFLSFFASVITIEGN